MVSVQSTKQTDLLTVAVRPRESVLTGRVRNIKVLGEGNREFTAKWHIRVVESSNGDMTIIAAKKDGTMELPDEGQLVRCMGTMGREWFFIRAFTYLGEPRNRLSRTRFPDYRGRDVEIVIDLILDVLRRHGRVNADDVYSDVKEELPDRDPRIIGTAFGILSRNGTIKAGDHVTSKRIDMNHGRSIREWHWRVQP